LVAGSNPAGGATILPAAFGEILSFGLWERKQGYREWTVRASVQALKALARRVNLFEPETVKEYLAFAKISESRKAKLSADLQRFYRHLAIAFEKPNYRQPEKLPFIPLESEVEQVVSGMGKKTACFLQLLRETGARAGEAWNIRWRDIDAERSAVTLWPEKNSRPRQLKLSNRLIAMLNSQPRNTVFVFHQSDADPIASLCNARRNYERQRERLAAKLQNPRLLQISFKTFRHFKATMEYHRTKDILHVMQLLGHKNIKNTLVYTHLVNFESDDYVCKAAATVDEAKALIESGFDYVTDVDRMKLFRKRK
jgi:integrase